jgi:hypothetical protein
LPIVVGWWCARRFQQEEFAGVGRAILQQRGRRIAAVSTCTVYSVIPRPDVVAGHLLARIDRALAVGQRSWVLRPSVKG